MNHRIQKILFNEVIQQILFYHEHEHKVTDRICERAIVSLINFLSFLILWPKKKCITWILITMHEFVFMKTVAQDIAWKLIHLRNVFVYVHTPLHFIILIW